MSFGNQINYKQLLRRHERIRVPMIQRDYAQGRPSEKDVREEFLKALKDALSKPADDPSLPLNLDFIYGSIEGNEQTRFLPLDGQQRLTTLFLLHWYLAWRDDQWTAFEQLFLLEGHSRFAYSVRPSSNEFFDQLVCCRLAFSPTKGQSPAIWIADQPWYFRSWRLDPTIQAVLHMLDAIHNKFYESAGLFARLVDEDRPAITFLLLDLENFGLSDDLYIKMNARGKPLTAFETFKARYEQELANQLQGETFWIGEQAFDGADYIARRMDTAWANLFWKHRSPGTNLYDAAFMNMFRAIALITRDPESSEYLRDFDKLRTGIKPPSYTDFHSYNWLDEKFTRTLMHLLDSWCGSDSLLHQHLPDDCYFNEKVFFGRVMSNGANLSYVDLVQFTGYVWFIVKHQDDIDSGCFQEWMRIVRNLGVNTVYNRPDDFRRSARGLVGLIEYSGDILAHFAQSEKPATGFSEAQIVEEKLKAQLILADGGWRELVNRAEGHGYFRGQIGFLLNFAGLVTRSLESEPSNWDASEHVAFQKAFERYLDVAESMFSEKGLTDLGEYRWQRALLSLGDYFLPRNRNRSFLVNSITDEASWKRLLSGSGDRVAVARNILKSLWQKLVPNADISGQLDKIITEADLPDPWRKAMIECPAAFAYCEHNLIRVNDYGTVYLLKRFQMNGAHAELFTYCLYGKLKSLAQNGGLSPLKLMEYRFSKETAVEPSIRFSWLGDKVGYFELEGTKGDFVLFRRLDHGENGAGFIGFLVENAGFRLTEQRIERRCAHSEIISVIDELRKGLIKFSEGGTQNGEENTP